MKFGTTWKAEVAKLPAALQQFVLSYKKWKKLSNKDATAPLLKDQLQSECEHISAQFKAYTEAVLRPSVSKTRRWCCFPKVKAMNRVYHLEDITQQDLYQCALLNKTTLYKICKRMDKRSRAHLYRQWLQKHAHEFHFEHGLYLSRLALELDHTDLTCPICLDEYKETDKPFVLLRCGHPMCFECMMDFFHIKGKKGTFHNLLHISDIFHHTTCPTCRCPQPLTNIRSINVFPATETHLLKGIYH